MLQLSCLISQVYELQCRLPVTNRQICVMCSSICFYVFMYVFIYLFIYLFLFFLHKERKNFMYLLDSLGNSFSLLLSV